MSDKPQERRIRLDARLTGEGIVFIKPKEKKVVDKPITLQVQTSDDMFLDIDTSKAKILMPNGDEYLLHDLLLVAIDALEDKALTPKNYL